MTKPEPPRKPPYHPDATVREQIAAGPKYEPVDGECAACRDFGEPSNNVDRTTGLGPNCWIAWRWSPVAERRNPCTATTETP